MTSMFDTLRAAARKRREFAGILAEFDGMSDRELNDIGISRADARQIARKAVYGA